jgi:peroxiredoxin Q/BCP
MSANVRLNRAVSISLFVYPNTFFFDRNRHLSYSLDGSINVTICNRTAITPEPRGNSFMALSVGTTAPDFSAKDTNGNTVSLAHYAGKTVVLYFYPKDDTPGCTKEACSFRDSYAEYQGKDIAVFGVSMDDEASHQAFTQKFNLPFPLLSDRDGTIARSYDVDGGGYAKRVTYVIDGSGKISQVYTSIKTDTHASDILAELGV